MNITPVHCPSCHAVVSVPDGAEQLTCDYCGTTSIIELSQGQVTLKLSKEIEGLRQSVVDSNQSTARSVQDSAASTQRDLERLRLSQELSTVEMRLSAAQTELRMLQRSPDKKNKTLKKQSEALEREISELSSRDRYLRASIATLSSNPVAADGAVIGGGSMSRTTGGRGALLGCLGWGLLWLLLASLLTSAIGEVGVIFSIVVVVGLFVWRKRRKSGNPVATQ